LDDVGGFMTVAHPFRHFFDPIHFRRDGRPPFEMTPEEAAERMPVFKLVDEIGDEYAARAWLKANKGVDDDLPVRDWKSGSLTSEFRWLDALAGLAQWLGVAPLASLLGGDAFVAAAARVQLDGLLAIWQPPLAD